MSKNTIKTISPTVLFGGLTMLLMGLSVWLIIRYPYQADAQALVIVIISLTLIYLVQFFSSKQKKVLQIITPLSVVLIIFLLIVQSAILLMNPYQYTLPGWFYQLKLHRLLTLPSSLFVRWVLLGIGVYWSAKIDFRDLFSSKKNLLLVSCIFAVGLWQLQLGLGSGISATFRSFQNLSTPYFDRITSSMGGVGYYGWVWPYSQFIKRFTPEDAVILLPTQSNDWKMEGNIYYFRWYLYPRVLVHLNKNIVPSGTKYLLIARGECIIECGWPKFPIPSEKIERIILLDRNTLEEKVVTLESYDPEKYRDSWGIIQLKEEYSL